LLILDVNFSGIFTKFPRAKSAVESPSPIVCLTTTYEIYANSNERRIGPMNYDSIPTHPFPDAAFDSLTNVLGLEEDYPRCERLQAPSGAFQVPLNNGHSGGS
jgi:hypothetical protein